MNRVLEVLGRLPAAALVVIAVVLDNPRGRGFGGRAAAPVFSRVAAGAVHYLSTPSTSPSQQDGVLRVALR